MLLQYVKMAHMLEGFIAKKCLVKPLVFEGSMNQKQRDAVVAQFETDPASQVFIISLKVG